MNTGSQSAQKNTPKGVFLATAVIIFFCTLSFADSIGFVPYYIDGTDPSAASTIAASDSHDLALSSLPQLGDNTGDANAALAAAVHTATAPKKAVYPVRIRIENADINLPIQNPSTTDVAALDALLVNGPARYVNSSKLGQSGNMVIFAHSSHLPVVHNKMFQAFNNIPDLSKGDAITITGTDGVDYIYTVESVVKATTDDGTKIPLDVSGTKLTLVTCDTLTGKSARFILSADFVGTN